MSKPLELKVLPKSRGFFGVQYQMANGRQMHGYQGADVMSQRKRLKDSELAAEVWHSIVKFYEESPSSDAVKEASRNAVIERFAMHPHYDEPTP